MKYNVQGFTINITSDNIQFIIGINQSLTIIFLEFPGLFLERSLWNWQCILHTHRIPCAIKKDQELFWNWRSAAPKSIGKFERSAPQCDVHVLWWSHTHYAHSNRHLHLLGNTLWCISMRFSLLTKYILNIHSRKTWEVERSIFWHEIMKFVCHWSIRI